MKITLFSKPSLADDISEEIETQLRVAIARNLDRIEAENKAVVAMQKLAYLQSIDLTDSSTFKE
jgi:hypothetical protein